MRVSLLSVLDFAFKQADATVLDCAFAAGNMSALK